MKTMKITPIAATAAVPAGMGDFLDRKDFVAVGRPMIGDFISEIAGRICYDSYNRPNAKTADNRGYLANILRQGHESVLEHQTAVFHIEGVSRYLLAELTRHRHLSFSVRSTRYVDEAGSEFADLVALGEDPDMDAWVSASFTGAMRSAHIIAVRNYSEWVDRLASVGLDRKTARGVARAFLPGQLATEMIVSGNLRAWRDVLKKRLHPAADAEIRYMAWRVLEALRLIAPNSVQDMDDATRHGIPQRPELPEGVKFVPIGSKVRYVGDGYEWVGTVKEFNLREDDGRLRVVLYGHIEDGGQFAVEPGDVEVLP